MSRLIVTIWSVRDRMSGVVTRFAYPCSSLSMVWYFTAVASLSPLDFNAAERAEASCD